MKKQKQKKHLYTRGRTQGIFNRNRMLYVAGGFCTKAIVKALNCTAETAEEDYCDVVRFAEYRMELIAKLAQTEGTRAALDDLSIIMQRVRMHYEGVLTTAMVNAASAGAK
jgi:hypothetical protein